VGRGSIRVHVNTVQLPDGFTRTVIRSSFRGYGRSVDRFAMKGILELDSNNNFEDSIASALRTHFTAAPPEGTRRLWKSLEIPLLTSLWNEEEWALGFSD
jgi:hypothetical protein